MAKYKPYSSQTKSFSSRHPTIPKWSNISEEYDEYLKEKKYKPYLSKDLPAFPKNFKVLEQEDKYLLIEHQITRERKWVDQIEIQVKCVANAFYDADYKFSPKGISKWDT